MFAGPHTPQTCPSRLGARRAYYISTHAAPFPFEFICGLLYGAIGAPMEQALGNTITKASPSVRAVGCKRWCFTLNNYTVEQKEQLSLQFAKANCKFVIGEEVGEGGTPHLQGYIECDRRIRPIETFKTTQVHWEKCRGDRDSNIKYCTKDGKFTSTFPVPRPVKTIEQLRPWQLEIEQIISQEADDRTIHWYWEPAGNFGKTTFCKYLSLKHKAIPLEGKKNDILYCAAEFESDIYIWDLERSMEEFISYGALEKIKNGYFMCSKYESKPIVRNCPHVICFANFPPRLECLSADRWHVVELKNTAE